MKLTIKEKIVDHPMEDVLDIEPCTTVVEYKAPLPAEIVEAPNYDSKDMEIEEKLEEIYTAAMGTVEVMGDEIESVEGKYKARMGEVTATMLNVALGAVREKSQLKMHKDKTRPSAGPATVNNNLVFADRNEILRMLLDKKKSGD